MSCVPVSNYVPDNSQNITELSRWAEANSSAEREFLFKKMGEFLTDGERQFSDIEKQIMSDVLCRIIGDVELEIRKELAEKLAPLPDIPHKLVVFLANSDIEVAFPILKASTVLSDPDLLEIIEHKTSQHQLAIAVRSTVSEAISKALCEAENNEVAVALLNNPGASVSDQLLEFLTDKSETEVMLQAPLIKRPQLPTHLAQKMYQWVSAALKTYIAENFEIDKSLLNLERKTELQIVKKFTDKQSPSASLVEKLHDAGELGTGFMLKSLRQGNIELFELSFARLSNLKHSQVRHILYNNNKELLAVACKLIELDRIVFSTIYELLSRLDTHSATSGEYYKLEILEWYDRLSPSQAAPLIRTPDFLTGKKQLSELITLH